MKSTIYREDVIEQIICEIPKDSIVVSTTGKTSRELFELRARLNQSHKTDFLTVGSMGHSSAIALGIALFKSKKKVVCLDGDGALIMQMGGLSTIGRTMPKNFVHILLNNEVHESVGGQPTSAKNIDFIELAKSNGYQFAFKMMKKNFSYTD